MILQKVEENAIPVKAEVQGCSTNQIPLGEITTFF